MQRNISVAIPLSQKYDKITYFICNPQTKFIAYEKSCLFFYGEAALYYCSESIYLIFNFFSISLGIAFLCTTIFIVL